jgi:Protein of unknown function (DUF2971)
LQIEFHPGCKAPNAVHFYHRLLGLIGNLWWNTPRNDLEVFREFARALFTDVRPKDGFNVKKPLLAHYTSLSTLEQIVTNDELWFSNPLYMNDFEELRFGMQEGLSAFRENIGEMAKACRSAESGTKLVRTIEDLFRDFELVHSFDIYVTCFSAHDHNDNDGLLSMWRGYGGNGSGAAIVMDSAKLNLSETSPLIIAEVQYHSREVRRTMIKAKIDQFAQLVRDVDPEESQFRIAATLLLERLKLLALTTKHHGFSEEKEWRIVYSKQRDLGHSLEPMLSYAIGPGGIEPNLKFKIGYIENVTAQDLSLAKVVERIILGPTISGPMSLLTVRRMLVSAKKPELAERVVASQTPFRSS